MIRLPWCMTHTTTVSVVHCNIPQVQQFVHHSAHIDTEFGCEFPLCAGAPLRWPSLVCVAADSRVFCRMSACECRSDANRHGTIDLFVWWVGWHCLAAFATAIQGRCWPWTPPAATHCLIFAVVSPSMLSHSLTFCMPMICDRGHCGNQQHDALHGTIACDQHQHRQLYSMTAAFSADTVGPLFCMPICSRAPLSPLGPGNVTHVYLFNI